MEMLRETRLMIAHADADADADGGGGGRLSWVCLLGIHMWVCEYQQLAGVANRACQLARRTETVVVRCGAGNIGST